MGRSLPVSLAIRAAARIFRAYTGSTARDFDRAIADPIAAQDAVLRRLAAATARTRYGRDHGLPEDADYARWCAQLPAVTWLELEPWLAAERETPGTLVPDRVVQWAVTAGRTGPRKRVPYTAALKDTFTRAVFAWCHDVLAAGLELRTGFCFLPVRRRTTPADGTGDVEEETDYLAGPLAALLRQFVVVDPRARELPSDEDFQLAVAASLVAAAELEIITIWDPDLMVELLDFIAKEREPIAAVLADRRFERASHAFKFPRLSDDRRAALLAGDLPALWPMLRLVSTCNHAMGAAGAAELARRLPHAPHQGKGLLTTEAPLTIPLHASGGFVPLVDEILYELERADGAIIRLHEAQAGSEYALVISQAGGLVRYRIGERVRITHVWREIPCMEYVGRA